ncbi:MAG: hypothetical protein U9N76_00520 [Candidatus Marinimicrobia bacterium]|nr:hypothetical protein [Candidatus Neomarinimicrobiota bacterium]
MEIKDKNSTNQILIQWQIYPLKKNPAKGIVVGVFILIISTYSAMLMGNIAFFLIILMVFFIFVLLPYYLPTKYILTEKKIIIKNGPSKKEREWQYIKRFDYDKKMLKLFTTTKTNRLDNYRALTLIFNNNREEVIKIVENKISNNNVLEKSKM